MSGAGIDIGNFHPWGDLSWTEGASCRGHKGPDWWFPERDNADAYYAKARKVCAACPVKQACADYAKEARIGIGMWGGLTPEDRGMTRLASRKSVTKAKIRQAPEGEPIEGHGIASRYDAGCRCDHCRWAMHQRYVKKRDAKKSTGPVPPSTGSTRVSQLRSSGDVLQPSVEQREAGPGAAVTAAEALEPRPSGGQDS